MEQYSTKHVHDDCVITVQRNLLTIRNARTTGSIRHATLEPVICIALSDDGGIIIYATQSMLYYMGEFAQNLEHRNCQQIKMWSTPLDTMLEHLKFEDGLIHIDFNDHFLRYTMEGKVFLEEEVVPIGS